MKTVYQQDINVQASLADMNMEMGVLQSISKVQDNMCEYFRLLKCDGPTLIPQCSCFFVLTKTKIHFDKFARWSDTVVATSELSGLSRVAVDLRTDFLDKTSGQVFASARQELCAMDCDTRRLRMINTTPFPLDIELSGDNDKPYTRINVEFDESDFINEVTIGSMNIDLYQHTNNVEYVRLIMSTLDKEFILNNRITDFEIHYVAESRYADILRIYRKEVDGVMYFGVKHNDKVITKAMLNYVAR